jgi:glycosyltransferase involved in cell wall biosynthesis
VDLVFCACASLILYNLVVFPFVVIALSFPLGRPVRKSGSCLPTLTVLITAHNEEKHIRRKLANTLALDYPPDLMEILVALDGCTDRTAEIARSFADPRIRVLDYSVRRGKTAVQNDGTVEAKGEIILYTDATALLNPEAARELVANLADPGVACATGWVYYPQARNAIRAGAYTRGAYELFLRRRIGLLYSMLGAAGAIMAMPKRFVKPVDGGLNHDYAAPILALMEGRRTVYEPAAKAIIARPISDVDELALRTRVAAQGLRCIFEMPRTLDPLRHPVLSFMIISMRLLKWLLPLLFLAAFVSNLFLLTRPFYRATLAVQLLVALLAAVGAIWHRKQTPPAVFSVPFYFFILNISALRGLWLYAKRETFTTWQATSR